MTTLGILALVLLTVEAPAPAAYGESVSVVASGEVEVHSVAGEQMKTVDQEPLAGASREGMPGPAEVSPLGLQSPPAANRFDDPCGGGWGCQYQWDPLTQCCYPISPPGCIAFCPW